MKITSIKISKEINPNGLDDVDIYGMDQIVLLAGKNGSGKTRLLNKLKYVCSNKDKPKVLNTLGHIYKAEKAKTEPPPPKDKCNIETIPASQKHFSIIDMSITKPELSPAHDKSPSALDGSAQAAKKPGCNNMYNSTLSVITYLQESWINEKASTNNLEIITDYNNLCNLIKLLLNTKLDRNYAKRQPTLFGKNLSELKISKGEQVLLQLCVTIHMQKEKLDNLVLCMDEPENHLHPSAIIEVIDRLLKIIPNGQLWIATHSVNIISKFYDGKNLWFLNDGEISFISRNPEQVIKGLLGGNTDIMKLRAFIDEPMNHAMVRFTAECLCPPKATITPTGDLQCAQIYRILTEAKIKEAPMRIVDFGAGKGRLLADLTYLYENECKSLSEQIEYIAFDTNKNDAEYCKGKIANEFGNCDNNYFNDKQKLLENYENSVDAIVLCNVLHEISPNEWIETFDNIAQLLNKNGYLLIVENHQIATGEMAHEYGFIVLDTESLKILFNTKEGKNFKVAVHEDRSTLKIHGIGKQLLKNLNISSIKKAFCNHRKESINFIKEAREKKDPNYKDGLNHAFWVHQYANTSLYLDETN